MKKLFYILAIITMFFSIPSSAQFADMSKFIELKVKNGQTIKLNFKVSEDNGWVCLKSGSREINIGVGNADSWMSEPEEFTANGNIIYIYGKVIGLNCSKNGSNIIYIDFTNNTELTDLLCRDNELISLNVSALTKLKKLDCSNNKITSLDLSNLSNLINLYCSDNRLTSLNISNNTNLKEVRCFGNSLTSLVTSNNIELQELYCKKT